MQSQHSSNTSPTLTTFTRVPPFAVGLVRDIRVRWALEEAGRPYQLRLVGPDEVPTPAYRQQQPFGQVPVFQEGELTLFESGSILAHIAQAAPELMPADEAGRAQTLTWMFAALNSVEPHVLNLAELDLFNAGEEWVEQRRPALRERLEKRFADLDNWLKDRDYLTGQFSVADILMNTVLRFLKHTDIVARYPALHAYHQRCTARPAFGRALAAQLALYAPEQAAANA
jgi:glutathione S-transferase